MRRCGALGLAFVLAACGPAGGTASDAAAEGDGRAPVSPGPNACAQAGGTCVPGMRGAMGFTLSCPSGRALYNGRASYFGPGTGLLSGPVNGGCPNGSNGFEAAVFGCCYPAPADAGADVATEPPGDAGDAGADGD